MKVELLLIHLSSNEQVENDQDGSVLDSILSELFGQSRPVTPKPKETTTTTMHPLAWSNTTEWTKQHITRYVQIRDKYLALCSVLLKSRAYHQTYHHCYSQQQLQPVRREEGTTNTSLPIVELPRTTHNQPYIPSSHNHSHLETNNRHNNQSHHHPYPLSISHQYPFAGSVRLVQSNQYHHHDPCNPPSKIFMVGLDIVVFDPINHRLYNNTLEFVNVFRDSFSKNEFDAILSSGTLTNPVLQPPAAATTTTTKPLCDRDDHSQLRELYLRWAVKEAYTKALGIGMGFDFSSFETTLNQLGNNTNSSIWHWLLDTNTTNQPSGRQTATTTTTNTTGSSSSSPIRFTTGTVTQLHDSADATLLPRRPTQEQWAFIFHPLYSTTSISSTTKEENEKDMLGCACVCVGPLSNDNHFNMQDMELDVDWSSLQELIQFHVRDS